RVRQLPPVLRGGAAVRGGLLPRPGRGDRDALPDGGGPPLRPARPSTGGARSPAQPGGAGVTRPRRRFTRGGLATSRATGRRRPIGVTSATPPPRPGTPRRRCAD